MIRRLERKAMWVGKITNLVMNERGIALVTVLLVALVIATLAVAAAVLAHSPLAVALLTLHIEWFVQQHYVESIKDDQDLDPQFKSLLKHHWLEEAQHTKLDTLMVEELGEQGLDSGEVAAALEEPAKLRDTVSRSRCRSRPRS